MAQGGRNHPEQGGSDRKHPQLSTGLSCRHRPAQLCARAQKSRLVVRLLSDAEPTQVTGGPDWGQAACGLQRPGGQKGGWRSGWTSRGRGWTQSASQGEGAGHWLHKGQRGALGCLVLLSPGTSTRPVSLHGNTTEPACESSGTVRPASDLTRRLSVQPLRWAETLLTLLKTWSQQQVPRRPRMATDEGCGPESNARLVTKSLSTRAHGPSLEVLLDPS